MPIQFDDLEPGNPEEVAPTGTVEVIVKVRASGYVPPEARLRARIDENLFTAEVAADELASLERDPQVESVARNRKLRLID